MDLLGCRVVAVRVTTRDEPRNCGLVRRLPLRLEVRRVRTTDLGPLMPVDPEPAKAVENRLERLGHVALLVGIVDAQQELPAPLA